MPNYTLHCVECSHEETAFYPLARFGKWAKHCGKKMVQVVQPSQVVKDIEPFRSMVVDVATGDCPIIRSRSHKQEFMRRNKLIEWGTEKIREKRPEPVGRPIQELKRAVREVLGRQR